MNALRGEGARFAFGLPGNPEDLYDSLYDAADLQPVLVRHETSGVFMATAYAKFTRQPGIFFSSPGPGVANLVP